MEIGDRWICFCHKSLVLIIPHRQPTCYLIAHITAFDRYWLLRRRRLFSFRKRSLQFLTVDATIVNQAFSHDGCNYMFPGLSYNEANNTFLNSLRKNEVEAQVEFTLRIMVICNWCNS